MWLDVTMFFSVSTSNLLNVNYVFDDAPVHSKVTFDGMSSDLAT